jgi:ABC-2 type transport system ATP-binding protein
LSLPALRPAIEIEGLRKVYAASGNGAAKEALTGIDLTIPAGRSLACWGRTGRANRR